MTRKTQSGSRNGAPFRAVYHDSTKHDNDEVHSQQGTGETFAALLERRLNRRGLLRTGAAGVAAGALVLSAPAIGEIGRRIPGMGSLLAEETQAADAVPSTIAFQPIAPQPIESREVVVASGHRQAVLIAWGDPVVAGAPDWNPDAITPEAQAQQFGYNNDFLGFLPLPKDSRSSARGLLWVNHEYTNPELMFAAYDAENPTQQQVDIELQAHGGTVVELRRGGDGTMAIERASNLNRRVTGTTPIQISGPAAGHDWLKTSDDQTGTQVLGMLNNCAGGITPWGTVLTSEENFYQYFANLSGLPADDPRYAVHQRYGLPEEASDRKWEVFYERFDLAKEPNEPFRFGWITEVDPYDPQSTPVKHTALGRFRHEGATLGVSPTGRVVFYSGDDEQFEYIYKYVSNQAFDPSKPGMEQGLLDDGVLYVAKFVEDGSGEWLPLVYGNGPLTEENGFVSQADVVIKTRIAADLLGATKMDRPEDMQQNPVNKKLYAALTNNTKREQDQIDAANPRADNEFGHIIEITETDDDSTSVTFTWDIFLLCGDPSDPSTYFAGFPSDLVSPIAAPDNVNFDLDGNLWISTDGQPSTLKYADSLQAVPTTGEERGKVSQFLSVVWGAETASFDFSLDNRTLFVSVQHPGEGGTYEEPLGSDNGDPFIWPAGSKVARPAVIQVWAENHGRVGGGALAPISNAAFYRTWQRTDKPVAEIKVGRSWIWGPEATSFEFMEEYRDAPLGMRSVQYFDKSRMELNDQNSNAMWQQSTQSMWYVTNGLLAKELITGMLQLGDDEFVEREPAQINIAGDLDDPNGPTYATFKALLDQQPLPAGTPITQTIDRAGNAGEDASLGAHGISATQTVSETNHAVASVFWDFMNSTGMVFEDGEYKDGKLFESPFYATGLPITEAHWTQVKVSGDLCWVLVQAFERRVLTFTPQNPAGWQVEAGNTGRHYFSWRYGETP